MATPLADRIRPVTLEEVVGQKHILEKGKPLRTVIDSRNVPNLIFYGPSGTGKTTVANIIANSTNKKLFKLNGTSASIKDIKEIVEALDTLLTVNGVILYLDEIQYLNKKQQQSLLEYIENGKITLIASTTENPYFYIYKAILSRSTVFEFKLLSTEEIIPAIQRGFAVLADEQKIEFTFEDGVFTSIAMYSGGDVRKALNIAEFSALSVSVQNGKKHISKEIVEELAQKGSMRHDRDGDEHYDLLSALQKSIRGSDPDAAIHYLARILAAGDILSPCRRLLVTASEDIGLAYPQAISIVKACVDSALQLGLPEARIPLAQAVILLSTAPKSNTAYIAIQKAMQDVEQGRAGEIPRQLQNKHYDGVGNTVWGQHYLYPHDYTNHYIEQQYLPDSLKDTQYYTYGKNKTEQLAKAYWDKIINKDVIEK